MATTRVPQGKHARNLAKRFHKHGEAYFRFITTPGIEQPGSLTIEQVRSAVNTWLSAADLKPATRQERYEQELNHQRYHQRRNRQARKSHTKTRIIRLHVLGIDPDKIKSCIT